MSEVKPNLIRDARKLFEKAPCHATFEMELVYVAANTVTVKVKVSQDHTTSYPGSLQGGMLAVFTDSIMWLATMTYIESTKRGTLLDALNLQGPEFRTSGLKLQFIRGPQEGDLLTVSAKCVDVSVSHVPVSYQGESVRAKKKVYLATAKVNDQHGNLVATAQTKIQFV